MHQKSRLQWLKQGDESSKFFHAALRQRKMSNSIMVLISDSDEVVTESDKIQEMAVRFYEGLLGSLVEKLLTINPTMVRLGPLLSSSCAA